MRIAYLVNRYPAVSHSFIRREIEGVEAAGAEVLRFTIRPPGTDLPDGADRREAAQTTAIMGAGAAALLAAFGRRLMRDPLRTLSTLLFAVRLAGAHPDRILRHVAWLVQACWLLDHLAGVDHLHAHFGTNPASVALFARRLGGPPYSFTVHGPDEFDAPVALNLPTKIGEAAFVAAISSYGRSQLMRWSDPIHWPRIVIVRCGLDRSFLDAEPAADRRCDDFCAVARLSAQKGLPLLIDAVALLVRRGLDPRLTIVGEGELRPALERQIAAAGLGDRVALVGACDAAGVRGVLGSSRAMVLPSFAEGLPVVIMESLAVGTPVIVSGIAGTPELVDEGCGWVVPAGSVERLADAMADAIGATPERLAALGREGRRRVLAQHDAAANGAALVTAVRTSAKKLVFPAQAGIHSSRAPNGSPPARG